MQSFCDDMFTEFLAQIRPKMDEMPEVEGFLWNLFMLPIRLFFWPISLLTLPFRWLWNTFWNIILAPIRITLAIIGAFISITLSIIGTVF